MKPLKPCMQESTAGNSQVRETYQSKSHWENQSQRLATVLSMLPALNLSYMESNQLSPCISFPKPVGLCPQPAHAHPSRHQAAHRTSREVPRDAVTLYLKLSSQKNNFKLAFFNDESNNARGKIVF